MTWNPQTNQRIQQVDLTSTIASRSDANILTSLRSSDGGTYGYWEFPETAPLVFPALERLAAQSGAEGEKKLSEMAKKMKFAAEYWAKRVTAEYVSPSSTYFQSQISGLADVLRASDENPNSVLANVPQGEFTSRYSDPKSRAASRSVIAFVSGGKLVTNPESRGLIGGIFNVASQALRGEKQGLGWNRMNARKEYDQAAQSSTIPAESSVPPAIFQSTISEPAIWIC